MMNIQIEGPGNARLERSRGFRGKARRGDGGLLAAFKMNDSGGVYYGSQRLRDAPLLGSKVTTPEPREPEKLDAVRSVFR
jgi:hypothetical protein